MIKSHSPFFTGLAFSAIFFTGCAENKSTEPIAASTIPAEKTNFGGYETQAKWGEHLVTIAGDVG